MKMIWMVCTRKYKSIYDITTWICRKHFCSFRNIGWVDIQMILWYVSVNSHVAEPLKI